MSLFDENFVRDFFGMNARDAINTWRAQTGAPSPQCPFCGCWPHENIGQCPNVLKVEYYPDGMIKSVEKRAPSGKDAGAKS